MPRGGNKSRSTVKVSHGASGSKKTQMHAVTVAVDPEDNRPNLKEEYQKICGPTSHAPGNMFKRTQRSNVSEDEDKYDRPPKKSAKVSKTSGVRTAVTTLAQGTAMLSKSATPAMKKVIIDKQVAFVNDSLYDEMEALGVKLEMEEPSFIFSFYETYIKASLDKEIDAVRGMKTGGQGNPHVCHFTPLNKHIMVMPDIVEVSHGVRSEKQLKFYKMLIFKIVESTNTAMQKAGFKGKVYLKKLFYSALQSYWETSVWPIIAEEKKVKEEAEQLSPTLRVNSVQVVDVSEFEVKEERESEDDGGDEEEDEEEAAEDEEEAAEDPISP